MAKHALKRVRTFYPGGLSLWSGLIIVCGMLLSPVTELFGAENPSPSPTAVRLIASSASGWPQFRGPRRDGISDERGLLQSWPDGGPKVLWSAKGLGHGYSSPAFSTNSLFITGDAGDALHLWALDLNGQIRWKATNGMAWKADYPGARATPTYSAGKVYHENPHGRVACFSAETGREEWAVDLLTRFDGKNIYWGLSECLLVDERAVYATAGGLQALVVALDKKTGALLWKSEPLNDSEGDKSLESASYVSPILVQFGERRLLVSCSLRHLFCVDADTGKLQWTRRMPTTYSVLALMPVLVEDAIFMTAPYGKGGRLFRLVPPATPAGTVDVNEVWKTPLDTCQGGVVYRDGKLFGSYYPGRKGWAAIDAKTGVVLYDAADIVKGEVLYADNRLYTLSENGWMRLLEPTDTQFAVRGQFQLPGVSANDAWAHPVVLNHRLYLRYHEELFCYDIQAR